MIDFFVEPRRGGALQIPHYQYRRFNRTTRLFIKIFNHRGLRDKTENAEITYYINLQVTNHLSQFYQLRQKFFQFIHLQHICSIR